MCVCGTGILAWLVLVVSAETPNPKPLPETRLLEETSYIVCEPCVCISLWTQVPCIAGMFLLSRREKTLNLNPKSRTPNPKP